MNASEHRDMFHKIQNMNDNKFTVCPILSHTHGAAFDVGHFTLPALKGKITDLFSAYQGILAFYEK